MELGAKDIAVSGALILRGQCLPMGPDVRFEVMLRNRISFGMMCGVECAGNVTYLLDEAGCIGRESNKPLHRMPRAAPFFRTDLRSLTICAE
jgi:hypothetical protein